MGGIPHAAAVADDGCPACETTVIFDDGHAGERVERGVHADGARSLLNNFGMGCALLRARLPGIGLSSIGLRASRVVRMVSVRLTMSMR
jgi:hypothetical protein